MIYRVQVLLSTYNGARYLRPLLESVLAQNSVEVNIMVRDDGSSDGTLEVLRSYPSDQVSTLTGKNLGAPRSFLTLLECSSPTETYLALCDQDDVWLPQKLSRAVNAIQAQPVEKPVLYCSRLMLVNEKLQEAGLSRLPSRGPSFSNALVENIAIGATVVMNQSARQLLLQAKPEHEAILMHDAWAYLVVSAFGTVIYDPLPGILYRQHSKNTVGAMAGRWSARLQRASQIVGAYLRQAYEFERRYGADLTTENRHILDRFVGAQKTLTRRLLYAMSPDVYRQAFLDDVMMRLMICAGLM